MKIIGIDHIAIATKDLEQDSSFWKNILGLTYSGEEIVKNEGVISSIYDTRGGKVELLAVYGDDSPIAKFLEKRGPGLHHICLEVENIREAIDELKQKNIDIINDESSTGADGCDIVFIHPKSTGGVLVELCQKHDN